MAKKQKIKINKLIKMAYKENKRSSLLLYLILRILVIICMILQIINGSIFNAILCFLSLILLFIPFFIQNKFAITIPDGLEMAIYLFIFSSTILGEINNFYGIFPYWDTMLHTINGFLAAAVGFSFIDLLNKNSEHFNLSPIYLCLVAFCFSMTIGVLWEFLEYSIDQVFVSDMQKDTIVDKISSVSLNDKKENKAIVIEGINKTVFYDQDEQVLGEVKGGYLDIGLKDTMKDLFVNFIGAIIFSIFGFINLKLQKKGFIDNFVPKNAKRPMAKSVAKELEKYN